MNRTGIKIQTHIIQNAAESKILRDIHKGNSGLALHDVKQIPPLYWVAGPNQEVGALVPI